MSHIGWPQQLKATSNLQSLLVFAPERYGTLYLANDIGYTLKPITPKSTDVHQREPYQNQSTTFQSMSAVQEGKELQIHLDKTR